MRAPLLKHLCVCACTLLALALATSAHAGGIGAIKKAGKNISKSVKKVGKDVSNAAKKGGKDASDAFKDGRDSVTGKNLPSLNDRLQQIRRQYNVVEYDSGFPNRWDAEAHTATLMTKLMASHNDTRGHSRGVLAYKHAYGARYLSYAAAKWDPPFHR